MRWIIGLIVASGLWAQSFLSGPKVANISHSAAKVVTITDTNPASATVYWDIDSGTPYTYSATMIRWNASPYTQTGLLTGLAPSTTYYVQVVAGATSSSEVSFTTTADPSPHPAEPTAVTATAPSMPSITGNTYNIDAACSNFSSTLTTIAGLTDALNHEIVVPVGTQCVGEWILPARPSHTGWIVLRSGAVGTAAFPPAGVRWTKNWATSTTLATFITRVLGATRGVQTSIAGWEGSPCAQYGPPTVTVGEGGFSYNSSGPLGTIFGLLKCSDSYPAYTGLKTISACTGTNPATITVTGHTLVEGQMVELPGTCMAAAGKYFVYGVSGSNFNVYGASTAPGNGTMGVINMWRNPTHTKGAGAPVGACTTEEWYYDTSAGAHEAYWCVAGAWKKFVFVTSSLANHSTLQTQGNKYYLVGLELTAQQVPGYPDSYPSGWNIAVTSTLVEQGQVKNLLDAENHNSDIVVDRCYIHGLPKPARVDRGLTVMGDRVSIINSYFDEFQAWRNDQTGTYFGTAGSGVVDMSSGADFVLENNHLEASGINVFFTNGIYDARYEQPTNVLIRRNTFSKLTSWRTTGTQVWQYPNRHSLEWKAGKQVKVSGNIFDYNWSGILAGAWVTLTPRIDLSAPAAINLTSWKDGVLVLSTHPSYSPGDVIYVENTDAAHNGLREVLSNSCPSDCLTVTLLGTFSGSGSGVGTARLRSPGRRSSDFSIEHNTFFQGTEVFRLDGADGDSATTRKPPAQRWKIVNNLAVDIDIREYALSQRTDINGAYKLGDNGARLFMLSNGWLEDVIVNHNTYYGARGNAPTMSTTEDRRSEGLAMNDNLYQTTGAVQSGWIRSTTGYGITALNESWKRNGSASWASTGNTTCCGYSFTGYPVGYRWPTAEADVKWAKPQLTTGYDFRLRYDSPYISGGASRASDDLDVGADLDLLEAAQGRVSNVRARVTGTATATVSYLAPDSAACTVEYGTSSTWGTGSRSADSGGDRVRNVNLSGLTTGTLYHYRVLCAVEQPYGTFKTL